MPQRRALGHALWPIWAWDRDRATEFESQSAAERALLKAKQFMKAGVFRAARIVPA